jgi:uncharacterized membrane protein
MERPKLHIKTPVIGKIFNVIALMAFLSSIFYLITQWSVLPEKVPTHYNGIGEPDDWGHKGFIFIPLIIGIVLWVGLTILEKYPHLHNYSGLTEENVERKYKSSMMLLNFIKNEMLLFFAFSSFNDVVVANGKDSILGIWELPLFIGVIFSTLAFFMIRLFRAK